MDLDTFTFTGKSDMTVDMHEATRYVIVHVNGLNVSKKDVRVMHVASNKAMKLSWQKHVPENQFYVIEMESMMVRGELYKVSFGNFRGKIDDDLRGLYRSVYKDQDGNTK